MGRPTVALAVVSAASCAALAALPEANARPASSGWYAEGGLGAVTFLPGAADAAEPGPALNVRVGYELFSWLSLGISLAASSHEATVPPPPEGEWFQLYRGGGDLRLGGRAGSVAFFVEGGLGGSLLSSNVLERVMTVEPGERFSITFHGGAGLEYQLENRHYALGAAVDAFYAPQFDQIKAIESRLYLRYTYGGG